MGNAQSFSVCGAAASVDVQQETVQQVPADPEAAPADSQKDVPVPAPVADDKPVEAAEEAKEAVQEAAQEAVQEAAQQPAKEPAAQEAVQESVEEAVQEPAAEAVRVEEVKETAPAPVETGSLTITFELKGKTTEVKFEKRPLGFVFGAQKKGGCCSGGAETGKYVVTKIEKKGLKEVKVGMVIKKINDTEVPDKKEWVEFQEMMALAAKPLPEEEAALPAPAPTKPEDAPMQDVTATAPEAAPEAAKSAEPAVAPETAPEVAKAAEPEAAKAPEPEAAKASEPEAAADAEAKTEPAAATAA